MDRIDIIQYLCIEHQKMFRFRLIGMTYGIVMVNRNIYIIPIQSISQKIIENILSHECVLFDQSFMDTLRKEEKKRRIEISIH